MGGRHCLRIPNRVQKYHCKPDTTASLSKWNQENNAATATGWNKRRFSQMKDTLIWRTRPTVIKMKFAAFSRRHTISFFFSSFPYHTAEALMILVARFLGHSGRMSSRQISRRRNHSRWRALRIRRTFCRSSFSYLQIPATWPFQKDL